MPISAATVPVSASRGSVVFSSARKWSAASFAGYGTWVLGAPEMVLPAGQRELLAQAAELAATGRRVLVLAHGGGPLDGELLPRDPRAAAFVLLAERLRPDAAQTLAYFVAQGVTLKVISGDSPHTVAAVAARAGLPGAGHPVDARHLPDVDRMPVGVETSPGQTGKPANGRHPARSIRLISDRQWTPAGRARR